MPWSLASNEVGGVETTALAVFWGVQGGGGGSEVVTSDEVEDDEALAAATSRHGVLNGVVK